MRKTNPSTVCKVSRKIRESKLFNKQKRKFRNRTAHRKRRKVDSRVVETEVKNQMILHKSLGFTFRFRTYFMNLPRNKLKVVVNVVEKLVLDGAIPTCILMLVRDLMALRLKINVTTKADNGKRESTKKNYMNVMFHNKGMDMINLSRILNSNKVMAAVPNYLRGPLPIVRYTYTRTIAGKIFNNRKVVNELQVLCVVVTPQGINMSHVDMLLQVILVSLKTLN